MATAAKFGAQDLSGNIYSYSQLVAPVSNNNIVVTTTFANRNYADSRVRLALTSTPLTPLSASTVTGMMPYSASAATSIVSAIWQPLTISTTTNGTNVFTTASIAVTATTVTTNLITCASTVTLSVGMPVVFSSSLGNLLAGTTYYVLTVPSLTTFTVSSQQGGLAFTLTSATGAITVQQSTSILAIGQPVTFTGNVFGNVVPNQTFYVLTIPSSITFSVSSVPNGTVYPLSASSGAMCVSSLQMQNGTTSLGIDPANIVNPNVALTIGATTISTNVLTTATTAVTATTATSNLITCASTSMFAIGQPVVFTGTTFGGITAGTTYYVLSINSATQLTVSGSMGGFPVVLTTAAGTATVQQSTAGLVPNQPITFSGTTFGNVLAGVTYYVQTTPTATTFTLSAFVGGTQFALGTAVGTMQGNMQVPLPLTISTTTVTTNVLTTANIAVTATTATTNLITCASTANLVVGQVVQFSGALGNLVPATDYYIQSIPTSTTFTVSATRWGSAVALTTASGSVNVFQSTSQLVANQPIVFYGNALIGAALFGNIIAGTTYFVRDIVSAQSFTVSATSGGAQFALATAAGTMFTTTVPFLPFTGTVSNTSVTSNVFTMQSIPVTATTATTNLLTCWNTAWLAVGQPMQFSGALGNLVTGVQYFVQSIVNATQFTVSSYPGGPAVVLTTATGAMNLTLCCSNLMINQPIQFFNHQMNTASNVVVGTTYYVQSIPTAFTFTVSATPGGTPFALATASGTLQFTPMATASTVQNAIVSQPIAVTSTSATGNVLTTGIVTAITATSAGTNLITCNSTSTLAAGLPITVNSTIGSMIAGTTYYVLTINNATQFTVSTSWGGPVFGQIAATSTSVIAQHTTTNLRLYEPIVFTDSTFGNIIAGVTYYVQSIPTLTTFTVSTTYMGAQFTLGTVTGYMNATPLSQSLTTLITQPIVFTGQELTITSISGSTVSTSGNTSSLVVNQPVQFIGPTYGSVTAGVTYYIKELTNATQFTLSSTQGGLAITFSTPLSQPITMAALNHPALVPYSTYYIQSVPTYNTFTVSTTSNGSAAALVSSPGNMIANNNLVTVSSGVMTNLLPNQPVTMSSTSALSIGGAAVMSAASGTPYIVTNTTVTSNVITVSSTAPLAVNQPVAFYGQVFGNLVGGQTYYILSLLNSTTFTISSTIGGSQVSLATAAGTCWMLPLYYIKAITSATHFILSATPGGSPQIFAPGMGAGAITVQGHPAFTDFLEYDTPVTQTNTLKRTGIIVPPNTYLYASSNASMDNVTAIGIQEGV